MDSLGKANILDSLKWPDVSACFVEKKSWSILMLICNAVSLINFFSSKPEIDKVNWKLIRKFPVPKDEVNAYSFAFQMSTVNR